MKTVLSVATSAVAFYLVFVVLSYVVNMVLFAEAHEQIAFFRAEDDPIGSYFGLGLTTLIWSLFVATAFHNLRHHIGGASEALKGLKYGAGVFLFFVWQQEVLFFQFVEFNWGILISALLHMGLAFTLGGITIALVQRVFRPPEAV